MILFPCFSGSFSLIVSEFSKIDAGKGMAGKIEGDVFLDFTFGTHAVEVAVDEETGKVDVLNLIACYDINMAVIWFSV